MTEELDGKSKSDISMWTQQFIIKGWFACVKQSPHNNHQTELLCSVNHNTFQWSQSIHSTTNQQGIWSNAHSCAIKHLIGLRDNKYVTLSKFSSFTLIHLDIPFLLQFYEIWMERLNCTPFSHSKHNFWVAPLRIAGKWE